MFNINSRSVLLGAALALAGEVIAQGTQLLPYVFKSGSPIRADEMNANFAALGTALEQLQADDVHLSRFFQTDGSFAPGAEAGFGGSPCVLGDVRLATGEFTSSSTVPANGQTLNIMGSQVLYSMLGTLYGGDGRTTFALPDLRAVTPKSTNGQALSYVICTQGIYPNRQ